MMSFLEKKSAPNKANSSTSKQRTLSRAAQLAASAFVFDFDTAFRQGLDAREQTQPRIFWVLYMLLQRSLSVRFQLLFSVLSLLISTFKFFFIILGFFYFNIWVCLLSFCGE